MFPLVQPPSWALTCSSRFILPLFLKLRSSGAVVPLMAAAIGRPTIGGAALRAGGAGGLAGAGLPDGRQASSRRVHQVLGHCKMGERRASESRAAPESGEPQEINRVLISKCSISRSSQGDSSNQAGPTPGNHSTRELRRTKRKQEHQ